MAKRTKNRDQWDLAIDPASKCGWAAKNTSTGELLSGMWDLRNKGKEKGHGKIFLRLSSHLDEFRASHPVLRVFYEEPMGVFRNHNAAMVVLGIVGHLKSWCETNQLQCAGYPQKTLKKYATGNGNAGKDLIYAKAVERWPDQDIQSNDEADALFILHYALEHTP